MSRLRNMENLYKTNATKIQLSHPNERTSPQMFFINKSMCVWRRVLISNKRI